VEQLKNVSNTSVFECLSCQLQMSTVLLHTLLTDVFIMNVTAVQWHMPALLPSNFFSFHLYCTVILSSVPCCTPRGL